MVTRARALRVVVEAFEPEGDVAVGDLLAFGGQVLDPETEPDPAFLVLSETDQRAAEVAAADLLGTPSTSFR